jgi:hypothetical protein
MPLERTAALLPLAPAIGFWFAPEVVKPFGLAGQSPAFWFLVGLFYGVQAVTRRSSVFTVLSVLTGNLGLWVMWHQLGWGFAERPQLWLIPIALAGLVAEYLNRDRLTGAQGIGLRYLALSVIYVSSSTEFLRAVGESLALPLVLVVLSVCGVLAGAVLRIRSYVYLGVTFLMLVILTMIKYAAVDQERIWVFLLFCIVLGGAIFAAFAVYEKYRARILAALARFRQWQQ